MRAVVIDAFAGAEIVADTRRGQPPDFGSCPPAPGLGAGPTFPRHVKALRLPARP